MANKKIKVDLVFGADTSAALSNIQNLSQNLQQISNTKISIQGGNLESAVQSARLLNEQLAKVTNINTGKINFGALQKNLAEINTDVVTLANNLLNAGPVGQQAFSQLAMSISQANLTVKTTNKTLQELGKTLLNTIKWQAASTMIHGVMSAFSSGISHIKELDKALNDIRIVSGLSAEAMVNFTRKAKEAADALNSTTTEYAKASLIYFQQGLPVKEIEERTAATIKMAKTTGQSVEMVSDQLTAIWNNFDKGTKSLEYYADVITALGAATASSTEEIATGLEKFSAVAETVGLSYEYATSALATVTAQTRQSAEVVGTSFKTIFSRIQGLSLGETLDDGVDLNKYSQALEKIGVSVLNADGSLREMDDILDSLGSRWNTLGEAQQVAIAQTVGGIRQYNQLIALMENWDVMKGNLKIANEADGTLTEQFNIYQDSVEASEKELKKAKEDLFEVLFDSSMIKDFNNVLTDVISSITTLIKDAGGLKGLFDLGLQLLVANILPKLGTILKSIAGHVMNFTGGLKSGQMKTLLSLSQTLHDKGGSKSRSDKEIYNTAIGREDRNSKIEKKDYLKPINKGNSTEIQNQGLREQATIQAEILDTKRVILGVEDGLTEKQKIHYQHYIDEVSAQAELLRLARERQAEEQKNLEETKKRVELITRSRGRDIINEQYSKTEAAFIAQQSEEMNVAKADARFKHAENDSQYNETIDRAEARREAGLSSATKRRDEAIAAADAEFETKIAGPILGEDGVELTGAAKKEAKLRMKHQHGAAIAKANSDYALETAQVETEYDQTRQDADTKHTATSTAIEEELMSKETVIQEEGKVNKRNYAQKADFADEDTKSMSAVVDEQASSGGAVGAATTKMTEALTTSTEEDGSTHYAASIENLEKLGELQGEYTLGIEKAKGLQIEIGTAITKAGTNTKKTKKEQEQSKKVSKAIVDFTEEYGKELEGAAEESEELRKVLEKIKKAGKDFDLGDLDESELKTLEKGMGDVEDGLSEAKIAAGEMGEAMAGSMSQAIAGNDSLTQGYLDVSKSAEAATLATGEGEKQLQIYKDKSAELAVQKDPFGAITKAAGEGLTAFTNYTMGVSMLQSGMSAAFDENASNVERLMGVMTMLQGVMSVVNAVQSTANVINTIATLVTTLKTKANEKDQKATLTGIPLLLWNTSVTIANAVAKIFNAEASKGLAGVIMGVLAVGIVLGTIALVNHTMKTNEDTKATQESTAAKEQSAEASKGVAEAIREEAKELLELTNAYEEAYEVYKKTGEGKEDLILKGHEIVTALDDERAAILLLRGEYEEFYKYVASKSKEKTDEAINMGMGAIDAAADAFIAKENVEGTGGLWSIGVQGGGTQLQISLGESVDDESALAGYLEANKTHWWIDGDKLICQYTTPEDKAERLQELYQMREGVAAYARANNIDMSNSEWSSELAEMDESGAWDALSEVNSAYSANASTSIESRKSEYFTEDVDTQEEYDQKKEEYLKQVFQDSGLDYDKDKNSILGIDLIKQAEENLSGDTKLQNFETTQKALEGYADNEAASNFLNNGGLEQWIKDTGDKYTKDEALSLFIKVNPEIYTDEKDIAAAMTTTQEYLDGQQLEANLKIVTDAQSGLSENMTSDQWSDWQTKNAKLFDKDSSAYIGMNFTEFMNKSYSEQKDILGQKAAEFEGGPEKQIEALEAQNKHLLELRANTQIGTEEHKAYTEAINSNNVAIESLGKTIDNIEYDKINNEIVALDLNEGEFDSYLEQLKSQHKELRGLYSSATEYEKAMRKIALVNKKAEKGTSALAENWDDWNKALASGNASEISKVLPEINDSVQNILNLDTTQFSLLPDDFVQKNWGLIEEVVNGTEGAIDKLRDEAGKSILFTIDGAVDPNGNLDAGLQSIHDKIAGFDSEQFIVGVAIDPATEAEFFTACNEMINAAGMTAQQAEAYFASMGYDAEVEEIEVPQTTSWTVQSPKYDAEASAKAGVPIFGEGFTTIEGENVTTTKAVAVKTITPNGSYGGNVAVDTTTSPDIASKKSVSKPKLAEKKKETDVIERYKNIKSQIDEMDRAMQKAEATSDKLFGANKLAAMQAQNKMLANQIGLYKQYKKEAKSNLEADRQALANAAATAGETIGFDQFGNISNSNEILSKLVKQYNDAVDAANADQEVSDSEQIILDDLDEKISNFQEAKDQYEGTLDELKEIEDQIDEFVTQRQENNYAEFTYKLELNVKVEELEAQEIDYYLSKFDGDFYKMAESASLIMTQINMSTDKLSDLQTQQADALKLFTSIDETTGETFINEAQYVEQLEEIYGFTYDTLTALQELDQQMMDYYGNTLAIAQEELSKYIDKMSELNSVLDHYTSLMEIMGQGQNYAMNNMTLEAQVELKANKFEVDQATYDEAVSEVEKKSKAYEDAVKKHGADSKAAEMALKELEEAEKWAQTSQDAMLTSAEEWASAIAASTQNKLNGIYSDVEKFLTNGLSFDQQNTERDHMLSLQEGWLDETNKVYETNKMIRNIQNEIDKTTNSAAKTRLKSFMDQTKQMQQQKELSQFELDQQQRKYDLLLAEIALEEAQNAKSTVTLQRDAEGNYGYVYTAEETDVANKQQAVDDAENAIYNSSVEEAQNKSIELQTLNQEYVQRLQEIDQAWLDGMYASEEEYLHAKEEANNYYTQKILDTQYGYMIALAGTDEEKLAAAHTYREKSVENEQKRLADLEDARKRYEEGDFPSREAYLDEVERINNESYGRLGTMSDNYLTKIKTNNSLMTSPWLQTFGDPENPSNNPGSVLGIVSKSFGAINGVLSTHETRMGEVATNVGIDLEAIKTATDAGKGSFDQYAQTLDQIDLTKAGEKFGGLGEKIGEVTTKSDELVKKITDPKDGVIKKISDNIDEVSEATTEYRNMRDAVEQTVTQLENFARVIKEEIKDKTVNITFNPDKYPDALKIPDVEDVTVNYVVGTPLPEVDTSITIGVNYESTGPDDGFKDGDDYLYNDQYPDVKFNDPNLDPQGVADDYIAKEINKYVKQGYSISEAMGKVYEYYEIEHQNAGYKNEVRWSGSKELRTQGLKLYQSIKILQDYVAGIQDYDKAAKKWNEIFGSSDLYGYYEQDDDVAKEWIKQDLKAAGIELSESYLNVLFDELSAIYGPTAKYDTGGYTGEWGQFGKLAFLHEKELVLNKYDTENFLDAISILRSTNSITLDNILQQIENQIIQMSLAYTDLVNNLRFEKEKDILQQEVSINVEFPNVTSSDEIERAFENIVNEAAQYAYRR